MIPAVTIALLCVASLLGVATLAVAFGRRPWATQATYGATLGLSALGLAVAVAALAGHPAEPSRIALPLGLPWLGAHFRLDALAAFFLIVIGVGGVSSSLYGLGYGRHEIEPGRVLPFFPAFLAAMTLVVLADDAFTFLLSWEAMSLASWALVMAHHRDADNARAGHVYLIMAAFGGFAVLLAFGLLAGPDGGFGFDAIRQATRAPWVAPLVLGLMLLGAGSKAGLMPLHVWLPLAHPAAPSHVSALMSGVMTKVAVYGFVRVVFDLLGGSDWWSGMIVLFLGGVTAAMGILHALMERDLKRLLAYSTIENIGVIFAGLGLAMAFRSNGMAAPAALALTAALFHAFNHSLFKSLLFFGAGSVLTATGVRDIEKLGGLIHRMPVTSFMFLVGAVSISALPPLNGFASEWLIFQAILESPDLPQWGLKIMVPAVGGLLALAAALAAACFVRAFGITFLGQPRSDVVAGAREVDRFSLAAMGGLAALCLLAGLLPGIAIDALSPVARMLTGARMPVQGEVAWLSVVPIAESRSSYNGLLVFAFIALSASLAALAIHRFASDALRRGPAWGCGFPDVDASMQYTAASFAQPFRRVFGTMAFRAREHIDMPPPGDTRPARLVAEMRDPVWEGLYAPLVLGIQGAAGLLNGLQFLTIRRYLSLVFLMLVALLLALAIWT